MFVEVQEKNFLPTISKSLINVYKRCQRKVWLTKREPSYLDTPKSDALKIGILSHEIFAAKIAEKIGEKRRIKSSFEPEIYLKAKELADSADIDSLLKDAKVIGIEQEAQAYLNSDITLNGVFDLVLYKSDEFGDYIQITDYKTGYKVSQELDIEVIIYTYLAAKKYNMPIVFYRFSPQKYSGIYQRYFPIEEALSFGEILNQYTSEIKDVINSSTIPAPSPSEDCINCPFYLDCLEEAKSFDDKSLKEEELVELENLDKTISKMKMLETETKRIKNRLNAIAKEGRIETENYTASKNSSVSFRAKRKTSFDVFKILLRRHNILDLIETGAISFKITEEILPLIKELNEDENDSDVIDISATVRETLKIEKKEEI